MAQVKALFYLPLKDLDGRDLAAEIDQIEDELYVRFAGWTCQGYVKGAYQMADGTQSLDESAAYFVMIEEARVSEIEAILRDFKDQTLQEAIYLEIQRDIDIRLL
jgi:hypothetical protein